MRILPIAAVLALLGSAAVAQTDAPKGYVGAYGPDDPNRPFGGPVPEVYLGPGLNVVGPDGATKVVKAVPCSTAARGTDGTTTCDAVTTFFFLDCFTDAQADLLINRLQPALTPDAVWLFADFSEPSRGLMRLRAKAWLGVMYLFFRWQTGLASHRLPDSENLLRKSGFARLAETSFQHGFVRSTVFAKPPADR